MNEKVFAIVPVYNVERYLERCLNSLREQTYKNCVIVMVDDGSTDQSHTICDMFAEENNNFICIHKQNGGLSDARNAGLDYCLSQNDDGFVTFVDSDDFVRSDFISRCTEICIDSDCDMVQCGYEKGDSSTFLTSAEGEVSVLSARDALLGYRLKSQSCAKFYKLSIFKELRFPVNVWNEDEYVTYKAVYSCNKIAVTDATLYYYFQRKSSIMSDIAIKLKNNVHRDDWYKAYLQRIAFFESRRDNQQVRKTYEKICTDIILRYTEQMSVKKSERLEKHILESYLELYKKYYKLAMKKENIPSLRRAMYAAFYIFPYSSVIASKFRVLRK